MKRLPWFLGGLAAGILCTVAAAAVQVLFLANFLVVTSKPQPSDAIVILGGDATRLKPGVELFDQGLAPRLVLTGNKRENWLKAAQKHCPDCRLEERAAVFLEKSTNTHTDALLSLKYCQENGLKQLLVLTSPYHTRRSQFVFNDVYAGTGINPVVISSGNYTHYVPPEGKWWRDRHTVEVIWLEFGKILYWELTPFKEFQGDEG